MLVGFDQGSCWDGGLFLVMMMVESASSHMQLHADMSKHNAEKSTSHTAVNCKTQGTHQSRAAFDCKLECNRRRMIMIKFFDHLIRIFRLLMKIPLQVLMILVIGILSDMWSIDL